MKIQHYFYILLISILFANELPAQVPAPAPPQQQAIYLTGATAHIGDGRVIENCLLAFAEGKITYVGSADDTPDIDLSAYQKIEAAGMELYPGFIAPATNLGLVDIGLVRATRDYDEVGAINPNVHSIIAYNTDSPIIPTVRAQGILLAQVAPQGGRVSGSSSIVQLDAWNWEDAAYVTDDGLYISWPQIFSFSWQERSYAANKKYAEQVQELDIYFTEAKAYIENPEPEHTNLRFEAMRPLFEGKSKLYVRAQEAKEILHAIQFAKDKDVEMVIVDGREAWMVTEQLKANNIPVVLRATHNLPNRVHTDIDQPFKTPSLLKEAGVEFCFSQEGYWQQRNLAFQAGQAVGFGLDYEDAIAALTSQTAKILGIEDRTGTLEAGKDANMFLCEGDVLDVRTSKVISAFIQGRAVSLDHIQKRLYEKFKAKYEADR